MSLLNIKSKFILYDILFQIPIKKRLEIINCSKKLYQKLDYFPITKKLYDKLYNYLNNNIDSYCCKKYPIKSIFYISLNELAKKIQKKFPNKSNEFFELIQEIIIEIIKEKNIYIILYDDFISKFDLLNDDDDFDSKNDILNDNDFNSKYEELFKFNYYKYIIKFDIDFCEKILQNKSKILKNNINKIYGINLNLYDLKHEIKRKLYMISEKIEDESFYYSSDDDLEDKEKVFDLFLEYLEYLDLLNKNFAHIHFLKLDFSDFFNNFNEKEFEIIFNYISNFSKRNSIEILIFKDNTERTLSFIENYKNFIKTFNNLNELYFYKKFTNSNTRDFLYNAFQNKEDIINNIEDPNLILYNYLTDINKKNIKILNIEISNPCSINGNPGGGSFITLATESEDFSLISNFKNLEEFTLEYDWPAEYYFDAFISGNSLIEALNSLKKLKKVTFKVEDYLSELIPLLNVKDTKFISWDDIKNM